jgi:hypothetical protein
MVKIGQLFQIGFNWTRIAAINSLQRINLAKISLFNSRKTLKIIYLKIKNKFRNSMV